jgi:hypothetical protein
MLTNGTTIADAPEIQSVFIMIATFISLSFCFLSDSSLSIVLRSLIILVRSAIISSQTGAFPE